MISRNGQKKYKVKMGEAWKKAEKKDLQLYKIHKPEGYKDTTEEWLTLSQTPNSKQNQNE